MSNEIEIIEERALTVPEQAQAVTIQSNTDLEAADSLMALWKTIEKQVHDAFDPMVETAHEAHKKAVAQRKLYLDPIERGRAILKPKMVAWVTEQERLRKIKEQEIADKLREAAERERSEAASSAPTIQEAIEIASEVIVAPSVVVEKATPKTTTTFRTVWYAEVEDLLALCSYAVNGTDRDKQISELISPNMSTLNKMASESKGRFAIPGVVFKSRMV